MFYQRNIYDISYVTNHARVSFIFSSLHSLRLFSLPCHYSPNLSVLLYPSIDNTQPFCRPTTIRAWSSLYFIIHYSIVFGKYATLYFSSEWSAILSCRFFFNFDFIISLISIHNFHFKIPSFYQNID